MLWIIGILVLFLCTYILKIIQGPSIWNRLLGMNLVSTKIILIIIVFASMYSSGFFLDFAIIYAVCGFIGTIFLANFMSDRVVADKNKNSKKLKDQLFQGTGGKFKMQKGAKKENADHHQ